MSFSKVVLLLGGAACFLCVARAEPLLVKRTVQLQSGLPAVGAQVLVRSLNPKDGSLIEEKTATTDAQGTFALTIEAVKIEGYPDPMRSLGYVLVNAPGQALLLESFNEWVRSADADEPLKLHLDGGIEGRVLDAKDQAIENAQVEILSRSTNWSRLFFNSVGRKIQTPWMQTRSEATGHFVLRALEIKERREGTPGVLLNLTASTQREGTLSKGSTQTSYSIAWPAEKVEGHATLRLAPTETARGTITTLNDQPLEGVEVTLFGSPYESIEALPPTKSDAKGQWQIEGIERASVLVAQFRRDEFGDGVQQLVQERDGARAWSSSALKMAPMVEVEGVVLAEDGRPALSPLSLMALTVDRGYNDGNFAVHPRNFEIKPDAQGHFSLKVPAGIIQFRVRGNGYWEGGYDSPLSAVNIPVEGARDLKWRVVRLKGYFLQFKTGNPAGWDEVQIATRDQNGKEAVEPFHPLFFYPLRNEVKTGMEIRLTRHEKTGNKDVEILPWTKLDPAQKEWPRVINVP